MESQADPTVAVASPALKDPTAPTAPPADPRQAARMPRWLPRALVLALALYACFLLGSWAFHQLVGLLVNILLAFF
ncbi:AI-2E family transporter, partial [Streptomyces sp. NPDC055721]